MYNICLNKNAVIPLKPFKYYLYVIVVFGVFASNTF